MALLRKKDLLQRYNLKQDTLLSEEGEINFSKGRLRDTAKSFSYLDTYDIFLSHSYEDARIVKIIKEMLEDKGFKVYVDWIEDDHLDRGQVSTWTASILRERMRSCKSLIYLTSQSAEKSVWMPWELGYMDARTGRVVVAPILDEDEEFEGREYLGLYPYFDLTENTFYVHRKTDEWVNINEWMDGKNPIKHNY